MLPKVLQWLADWDNVTGLIAIVSLIMTSATWIHTILLNRQNLSFRIHEAQSQNGVSFFFVQIENYSKLPVAITRFQLVTAESEFDCVAIPHFVYQYTRRSGKEITSQKTFYSLQMPIELSPLGAVSGYILFDNPQAVLPAGSTDATFLICTNRGRKEKILLPLPEDFQYKL